jgi:hypothetical protein
MLLTDIALRLGIIVVIAVAAAGRAEAQSSPWQPERPVAGWLFTPSVAAGAFRDNNVRLVAGTADRAQWVLLVNPRGQLDFNGRRTRFGAGYSGSLESRQGASWTRFEQRMRLSVDRRMTPRLATRSAVSYAMAPTTDVLGEDTLLFADVAVRRLSMTGGIAGQLSRRTTLEGTYSFQRTQFEYDFDADLLGGELRGGHSHSPGVRLSHAISVRARADVAWIYTRGELSGDLPTFGVQQFEGAFSYRVARDTTVGGGGGAASLHVSSVEVNRWEPTFRAFLQQQIDRSTVSVQFARSVVPEFTFGSLSAAHSISARLSTPLEMGRSYVAGSVGLSRTEPIAGLVRGLNAQTVRVSGVVGYRLTRWLSAEAFVSRARQTPIGSDHATIRRTRIGFLFVTAQPMRID